METFTNWSNNKNTTVQCSRFWYLLDECNFTDSSVFGNQHIIFFNLNIAILLISNRINVNTVIPVNEAFFEICASNQKIISCLKIFCSCKTLPTYSCLKSCGFTQILYFPILRNHSHLSLLVTWLQFHANPIFCKCAFTAFSSSATCWFCCGNGVS